MRLSDQYAWNIVFILLFVALVVFAAMMLDSRAMRFLENITAFEFFILALASFRLTRLFVYDAITAFFREQFYDVVDRGGKQMLEKPTRGPRRTLADLLSCPWCIGMWASATVVFFHALTPYAWFPILFLAVGAVATTLQLLANLIGWKAEESKSRVVSE